MLGEIFQYLATWTGLLFLVQLVWQILMACIKHYYLYKLKSAPEVRRSDDERSDGDPSEGGERSALGIPYLRTMGHLLGLTGDNSPKKRIIAHDLWRSYSLVFATHFLSLELISDAIYIPWIPRTLSSLALALLFTGLLRASNTFILLKIYSEAGFGFNFYLRGFRIVGIDYHAWQIRQDPATGKPLPRDKQYWSRARPHLDIPPLKLHHWPFDQFDDAETLEALMSEKNAQRLEKQARKDEKRKRREAKLREKIDGSAQQPIAPPPQDTDTDEGAETAGLFQ